MAATTAWGWVATLALVIAPWAALAADESGASQPVAGVPEVAEPVVDSDYGVQVDALGLRREVQMWQWQRDGDTFRGTWSAEPIDASDFPADYANPGEPPYGSAQWIAGQVRLAGRRVAPELLADLPGWEPVPVEQAAASLPSNLAVVFQPDGIWLSSSADTGQPDVGDLRIRWQQLPVGPVHGSLVADGQRWVAVAPDSVLARGEPGAAADVDANDPVPGLPGRGPTGGGLTWLAWVLLAFMLVGGFVLYRRNR